MPTATKTKPPIETPLKRFLRESGLKYREVSKRVAIPTAEGPKELGQSAFYAIINGDRAVKIDEAQAIIAALRAMTGQMVTLEQLWPTNGSGPENP